MNACKTETITLDHFKLGETIFNQAEARYTIYGDFKNKKKSVLFFHAFSSNSKLHSWWDTFPLDTFLKHHNMICIDSLGSCHGSLGPQSINPSTNLPYLQTFPQVSIQDTVNFAMAVLDKLQLKKFDRIFGCSLGGMQTLDMFVRFPKMSPKFISACGVPLPLMTKMMNISQCNIIEEGFKNNLSIDELKSRMGLARFFLNLSCASEKSLALISLLEKQKNRPTTPVSTEELLSNYFIKDALEYQNTFSPYSYNLYMRMLANFALNDIENHHSDHQQSGATLTLIDIMGDQFTTPESVSNVYDLLRKKKLNVNKKTFETNLGHEAWALEGERFYEFIKNEFVD